VRRALRRPPTSGIARSRPHTAGKRDHGRQATWAPLSESAGRPVDALFRCVAVEVLVVGLRGVSAMADDTVPTIRRRIERTEPQGNAPGVDDVVRRPSRDDDDTPARIAIRPPSRTVSPLPSSTRKNRSSVWISAPISPLDFSAMKTSWTCVAVLRTNVQLSLDFARDRQSFDRLWTPSSVAGPAERQGGLTHLKDG
jgi:hypothetical protein